jgi:NADPH:quinone reductase-like Zn-dependent oxidoreductase
MKGRRALRQEDCPLQVAKEALVKAIRIHSYGSADQLKLEDAPDPALREDQVLVKIAYAGINPVDWKIREGYMKDRLKLPLPFTAGQDFSGTVMKVGSAVKDFKEGDEVFGFAQGAYAEYAAIAANEIAKIPRNLDATTAATIPTAGLTAWQALMDHAKITPGQKILIHGGAGGVGSFAVQIAKWKQVRVTATATGDDIDYVKNIGAERVIDYKSQSFDDLVHNADAVIDLVGGDTLKRSYSVIKDGGALVSTLGPIDQSEAANRNLRAVAMVMKRNNAELLQVGQLVGQGAVKPRVDQVFLLAEARKAQEVSQKGAAHGKLLLRVA